MLYLTTSCLGCNAIQGLCSFPITLDVIVCLFLIIGVVFDLRVKAKKDLRRLRFFIRSPISSLGQDFPGCLFV